MHYFPTSYVYHQWDGTGDASLAPDDIMDSLAEDLLHHGDIDLALQRAFRWGFQSPDGTHTEGLRDMLNRLRQQRQEMLDKWDFKSIAKDIQQRLDDILDRERQTLADRESRLGEPNGEQSDLDTDAAKAFLDHKRESLDQLPKGTADQIQQLRDYGFVDQQAQADFDELMSDLQQQVADSLFNNLKGALDGGDGTGSMEDMKEFLADINDAFEQQRRGEQVDLDKLNNRWANEMGGRIDSLEELAARMRSRMAASQAMMGMLSGNQRAELQKLMQQAMEDA
ncbi:MAG: hypothetical protein ACR2OE_03515, partial [Thermomicrobiales bacterium]